MRPLFASFVFVLAAVVGSAWVPTPASAQEQAAPLSPVTVAGKKPRVNRDALTRAELAAKPSANLYDVVMSLRSQWMRGPATVRSTVGITARSSSGGGFMSVADASPSTGVRAGAVPGTVVYVDGRPFGPLTSLRTMPAETAEKLCYYSLNRAQGRFGLSVQSPVVEVFTRSSTFTEEHC